MEDFFIEPDSQFLFSKTETPCKCGCHNKDCATMLFHAVPCCTGGVKYSAINIADFMLEQEDITNHLFDRFGDPITKGDIAQILLLMRNYAVLYHNFKMQENENTRP